MSDVLLIVDDEAMNRDMLSRRLKREGFETIAVDSGRGALKAISEHHIDVVLLDVMMPEMSGVDTLQKIRLEHSAGEMPVIMVSAAGDGAQIVEALSCGANDYVTKPVNMPILLARLKSQLVRKQEIIPFKAEVGSTLGSYKLEEKVGQGGMGTVFRALDMRLDRVVAVKVMHHELESQPDTVERFMKEARAVAKVSHPGVVAVYEVCNKPCHYTAMEYVEGISLDKYIGGHPVDVRVAVDFAIQIASALGFVHSHGVLHRDLKPSNLIVDKHSHVHLMDFGLAKMTEVADGLTKSGVLLGTPQYMPPEQVDRELGETSERSDLYGLGLILYEMLTGQPALKGTSLHRLLYEIVCRQPDAPSDTNSLVPPEVDAICLRLQATRPEDRYANAAEVEQVLRDCLGLLQ